ncbi:MAG: aminotransferase class III-fold pyridoxal phosphate-dependent enzyme, partial [Endozoicomonadaceae bacterium]|nr:aminotransferase class III-fold pyridoxal phosphate-dependent enzyme [Endozoicomonadaceae bacterium]
LKMTDAALLNQVSKRHKFLIQELTRLNKKYHVFKDIRGLGLLIGCELNEQYAGKARFFLQTSIQHNLMLLNAGTDILRITPPLIISDDEIAEGIKRLDATIAEIICH